MRAAWIDVAARHLRQRMTPAESRLWSELRGRQCRGLKFRRQHPLGPYVVDFFCAEHQLIVELDGSVHELMLDADVARSERLRHYGYRIIRFPNERVFADPDGVLRDIVTAALQPITHPSTDHSNVD